jgi:hypothetical protein
VEFDCYALEYRRIPRKIYAGVMAREIENQKVSFRTSLVLSKKDFQTFTNAARIMRALASSENFEAALQRPRPTQPEEWAIENLGRHSAESTPAMLQKLKESWLDEQVVEKGKEEIPKLSRRNLLMNRAKTALGTAAHRMTVNVPMRVFTYAKNTMTIDFVFALNTDVRMFQVVSTTANLDPAFVLAQRYRLIQEGAFKKGYTTSLTAVIEDEANLKDESIDEAVQALQNSRIRVERISALTKVAKEYPTHQQLAFMAAAGGSR